MSDKSSLGAQPGSEIIGIAMASFGDWLEAHPWTEALDIEDQADVYRQWCEITRLTAEISRLTERCAAYKGQIEAGAMRIEMAEAENARLATENEVLAIADQKMLREFQGRAETAEAALSEARAETDSAEVRMHQAITEADAARVEGWRQGIEAAGRVIGQWAMTGNLLLHCGEMSAQELRTTKAALRGVGAEIADFPLPVSGGVEGEKLDE